MWYEDTALVTPISDAELTKEQFVNLKKRGIISFNLYSEQIEPWPPAWYAEITYHLINGEEIYHYVFDPGREVWRRLEN